MNDVAEIYILEAPYHIDRPYRYYIPHETADCVVPGSIVEIPFGNGNRRMTGVVTNITEAADDEELKPILSAVGSYPPYLSAEALRICSFLKEHTLCTFGEAVRAVLPSAAISKMTEYYKVIPCEDGTRDVMSSMNEKAAFVYSAICSVKRISKEALRSRFGEDVSQILIRLVSAGLIEKQSEVKGGGSNVLRILKAYPSDTASPHPAMRSERQKLVLDEVTSHPGITQSELSDATGLDPQVVRAALSALEHKGLVSTSRVDVYRNSFTAETSALPGYSSDFELSAEQNNALARLSELYESEQPRAALLHGVTGSGKTNVILKLIDRVLADGRGVIMLVPEIALTPQTVGRFISRYGDKIAVIHSSLSAGERFDAWRRIRYGEASVVIGTRSAIFAPVKSLGLIVIDEEHEHTYKSDTNPKYLAHDVASFRCGETGATLVLASATPSIVSYYRAMSGRYTLVTLASRFGSAELPKVEVCDMRSELASGNTSPFSRSLISKIGENLECGKQTILFLNRRGYNSAITCRTCGSAIRCPHCSVTMTYHVKRGEALPHEREAGAGYAEVRREKGYLHCHMCGYRIGVPEKCPDCGSEHFMFTGCGTQLAENELMRLYPNVRIVRMDHDTTSGKDSHEELLSAFRDGNADVLLGTQMVTKGHDFPHVTTVGVLNADSSLYLDDYRASERTFSMLTQVIGRAGRASAPGESVIQTFCPQNDVITLAAAQDYEEFYRREIRIRRELTFPPFCDIALITIQSPDEAKLGHAAVRLSERIREYLRDEYSDIKSIIYGPFEAPVYKVQNVYRMRFVIKCRLNRRTRALISAILTDFSASGRSNIVRVTADLNPSSL